ncbi:hypothetical protein B0H12DRAFT_1224300 [Mycena haematopus]|nr:hypothetical protein B0H12DRAFT_1224300 [Mycena haematopus]
MKFTALFIFPALLVSASSAISVTVTFFTGADCGGSVLAVSNGATPGECVFLTNGGSSRSISYSGVPNEISFFESGGAHDECTDGATVVLGDGSGCRNAPAGRSSKKQQRECCRRDNARQLMLGGSIE